MPVAQPPPVHWINLERQFTHFRRELRQRPEWRHGPDRVRTVAREAYTGVSHGRTVVGATYCELGCGIYHPYGISTVFFLNGAELCFATDLHPTEAARAAEALGDLLLHILAFPDDWHWSEFPREKFLARARSFDLKALLAGNLERGVQGIPIYYALTDIHHPSLPPSSFDLISSRATLEHFMDFPAACRRMFELSRPGSVAYHVIDVVDHRAYEPTGHHFWSSLTEPDDWTDGICNRLRPSELRAGFEAAGYEILDYHIDEGEPPPDTWSRLGPRFRHLPPSDIRATTVSCALRRPVGR